ncbi:acyltransferase [Streptomyces inusitatus]|uniref:Acyltransferase n=1 Tax=Streptomyces inusitatus TaxID=68221 RepID=A0A918USU6_9ACTN|nr:acyltransferase [Streptomyces inusitatus]GGZ32637.1 acyltransferase [Streptomyces inusitatus]
MSEKSPSPRPTALPSLTGMRFIAALLVFLAHMSLARMFTDQQLNKEIDKYFGMLASIGVSFFFILSGFVLTWSARADDRPLLFWRRRLAKIYPTHFVTWIGGLLLILLTGRAVSMTEFAPGLFLVHAWVPKYEVLYGMNGVAWSLSVELIFYLLFPALLLLVNKIRPGSLWKWAGIMMLCVLAVPILAETLLPNEPAAGAKFGWLQFWAVYFLPASRLFEFVIGILLARIVMTGRWIPISRTMAMLSVVPGYLLTVWLPGSYGLVAPAVIPLALVVASGAHADAAGRPSLLSGRKAVRLGELSFAFYMVHLAVAYHGPVALGTGRQWGVFEAIVRTGGWFALTLLISWVLYHAVEMPVMRRWSRPKAPPSAPLSPADGASSNR